MGAFLLISLLCLRVIPCLNMFNVQMYIRPGITLKTLIMVLVVTTVETSPRLSYCFKIFNYWFAVSF